MSHLQYAEYHLDYFIRIIRAAVDIIISIAVLKIFYQQGFSIAGWNETQALLVYGLFQLTWTSNSMFFGAGIQALFIDIINGDLDKYLIKPIDSQFSASLRRIYISSTFRTFFALAIIIYAFTNLPLPSLISLLIGLLASLSAFTIFYSLNFMAATSAFWTFVGEFQVLLESIAAVSRFPSDFYSQTIRRIITAIPLIFISTVPAMAFTGKSYSLALISPLVAAITFILTRKLWQAGLRSYQSASS